MEIVIVSPECRRRDNLLSMLESIVSPSSIKMVEVCSDVLKITYPKDPAIVFIDYREPAAIYENDISKLIMSHVISYVVLLTSRNAVYKHFTHYSSCELVYDEICIEVLDHLLNTIQVKVL